MPSTAAIVACGRRRAKLIAAPSGLSAAARGSTASCILLNSDIWLAMIWRITQNASPGPARTRAETAVDHGKDWSRTGHLGRDCRPQRSGEHRADVRGAQAIARST